MKQTGGTVAVVTGAGGSVSPGAFPTAADQIYDDPAVRPARRSKSTVDG